MDSRLHDRGLTIGRPHPLDNPVWHALSGVQRRFAQTHQLAARYDPDVALFAALPDDPVADAWGSLGSLVGPGGVAILFRDTVGAPAGWHELFRIPARQMVGASASAGDRFSAEELGAGQVDEMLRLVGRTQPGPFARRTFELGTYLGVRSDGALVAMAGERMRLDGYTEISAVCTDFEHQGRGLASSLVRALVAIIKQRGEVPFLHVAIENIGAIRLYDALGFTTRRLVDAVGLRAPS